MIEDAPAISHEPVVLPRFAPNITPIPCTNVIKEALTNEIDKTETRLEDCIRVVTIVPNMTLRNGVFVEFVNVFSKNPPENALNPSPKNSIPKSKIATPAHNFPSCSFIESA
ncbi:hypothetical protein NHP164001_15700 [Helicobacter trogontum]|uniref:Uncharacterized protein n=1 Tax=Helicobacter trogontum TaxID=50960 RepID=A0ABQ0D5F3_9HELI